MSDDAVAADQAKAIHAAALCIPWGQVKPDAYRWMRTAFDALGGGCTMPSACPFCDHDPGRGGAGDALAERGETRVEWGVQLDADDGIDWCGDSRDAALHQIAQADPPGDLNALYSRTVVTGPWHRRSRPARPAQRPSGGEPGGE